MRRLLLTVVLLGCHRDLEVDPCAHDPAACAETETDTASSESSSDDSGSQLDSADMDSFVATDSAMPVDSVVAEVGDSAMTVDSVVADVPTDTCVCTPGETVAVSGTCAGALEKKTKTCTSGCTWGAETCALPKGWTAIAEPPVTFEGRAFGASAWTGGELIVHGGGRSLDGSATPFADGAIYRLSTNTWTLMPTTDAPAARSLHTGIWTGAEFIVWGGRSGSTYHATGSRYDSILKKWSALPPPTIAGRSSHVAVWAPTTGEMLVWGGTSASGTLADGAAYKTGLDSWTPMSAAPITGRSGAIAFWTGTEMLIWGGRDDVGPRTDGALYNPLTKTWRTFSSSSAPARSIPSGNLIGTSFLFFGGTSAAGPRGDGDELDLTKLIWLTMPTPSETILEKRVAHASWRGGGKLYVWSGFGDGGGGEIKMLTSGATYDLASRTWSSMSSSGAPSARGYATAASMTGGAIIWSGFGKPSGGIIDALHDGAIHVE